MKKELSDKLKEQYPKLLVQSKLPMTQTCMCWGFECGDGWYGILDRLFESITLHCEETGQFCEITQVKEKFGTLRVYVWGSDDYIEGLIEKAEQESARTCEYCGETGGVFQTGGWITTVCERCFEEKRKED